VLRTSSTRTDILKAGLTLLLGLLALGAFIIALGGTRLWESYHTYTLRFRSARELSTGRPVRFAGLQVGRIKSITLNPDRPSEVVVVIGVNQTMPLHDGTVARIAQRGLVGENYILLAPADPDGPLGPVLPPGSEIPTRESVGLPELTDAVGGLLADLRPRLERIAANLELVASADNAARLSDAAQSLQDLLGPDNRDRARQTLDRLPPLVEEMNRTVRAMREEVARVGSTTRKTMDAGSKQVGATGDRLAQTLSRLDGQVADLGRRLGDLTGRTAALADTVQGYARFDQERLEDILAAVRATADDLRDTARDLRERPWLLVRPQGEAR
jgi:phospholipid/cholesterol/gamma-HCH transport system substrate-binding protein